MNIVYFHRDMDGFSSACLLAQKFAEMQQGTKFTAVKYPAVPLEMDHRGHDVYVVDVSFSEKDMLRLEEEAQTFTFIDHHKTAEVVSDELRGELTEVFFDVERSATALTYEYLNGDGAVLPLWVQAVNDYDLGRWTAKTRPVHFAAAFYAKFAQNIARPWVVWTDYLSESYREMVELGKLLDDRAQYDLKQLMMFAENARIGDDACVAVNYYGPVIGPQLCNGIATRERFGVVFYRKDSRWYYSLRSVRGGVDVSKVAKRYGGGGHEHAAGFNTKELVVGFEDG